MTSGFASSGSGPCWMPDGPCALPGVQCAEGLVHEQDVRLHGQDAGDGRPLAHAAGEFMRKGVAELRQTHQPQIFQSLVPGPALRQPLELQAKSDVAQGIRGRRGLRS